MANITTTTIDTASIELADGAFRDELLTFAGADTYAKGTILGRVTASGKLVPFATAAADGSEVPKAVLTYDVTRTGAGDEPIRALIGGKVNRNRLIIDADGNGNNITNAILDQLRAAGITPIDVDQIGTL
jgi:hypothetical protein